MPYTCKNTILVFHTPAATLTHLLPHRRIKMFSSFDDKSLIVGKYQQLQRMIP